MHFASVLHRQKIVYVGHQREAPMQCSTPTIRYGALHIHPMESSVSFGGVRGWLWSAALPPTTAEDGNSAVLLMLLASIGSNFMDSHMKIH